MNPTPASADLGAKPHPAAGLPWWRIKWMWLIVGIPAVTVVAAFTTIAIAINTYDPPVRDAATEPAHIRQANSANTPPASHN